LPVIIHYSISHEDDTKISSISGLVSLHSQLKLKVSATFRSRRPCSWSGDRSLGSNAACKRVAIQQQIHHIAALHSTVLPRCSRCCCHTIGNNYDNGITIATSQRRWTIGNSTTTSNHSYSVFGHLRKIIHPLHGYYPVGKVYPRDPNPTSHVKTGIAKHAWRLGHKIPPVMKPEDSPVAIPHVALGSPTPQ
jgi:hypothetical protein